VSKNKLRISDCQSPNEKLTSVVVDLWFQSVFWSQRWTQQETNLRSEVPPCLMFVQRHRHIMWCLYRDAAAAAASRLVVGSFTISPANSVVPPNGQVQVTVECAADRAGYISEVSHCSTSSSAASSPCSLSLVCLLHWCVVCVCVYIHIIVRSNSCKNVVLQGCGRLRGSISFFLTTRSSQMNAEVANGVDPEC